MSDPLVLHLSDDALAALRREAAAVGDTPEGLLTRAVEQKYAPPVASETRAAVRDDALRRLFGSIPGPVPGGIDNEGIDADLGREYANNHEEP